ncbi:MFS transporter [Microbacterium terrisoli]|uniref:MFS transporter n=1 Tax=Microbacterium terrisoli TaxID=3242192 RepID=UPI00280410C6|nr:MFS transporter [Microbacterium protaetiae]
MTTTSSTVSRGTAMAGVASRVQHRTPFGFVLAIVAQVVMMAGASAPSPFYPVLAHRIGFDTGVIGTVFAAYAVAVLLTLLTAGSLSDHVGRRPVAIAGLVLLAGSMFVFWHADSVALLILARIVQGVASGLLISTLSAATLDLAPEGRTGLAALWNALAPGIGLALGAILSGIALDVTGAPLAEVFAAMTMAFVVLAALFALVPETAPRRPGAWRSLRFRLVVPGAVRADFWRSVPAVVAGWATGGLFLSLGANIVRDQLGAGGHIWQALPVTLLAGAGAVAAFTIRRRTPRTTLIFGTGALAAGTALSLVALAVTSLPLYLAAVVVTGRGFGTAFSGVLAWLSPKIPSTERADTLAMIFLVAYLAFGVPAVIAGMLVSALPIGTVCLGYGAVVIALALIALILRVRRAD